MRRALLAASVSSQVQWAEQPVLPAESTRCVAYDTVRDRVVLFTPAHGDVWEWDGVRWTQRAPAYTARHGKRR